MAGSGRVGDEVLAAYWEQALVGVTARAGAPVRQRPGGGWRQRRGMRRFSVPAVVLVLGVVASGALLALSPVRAERVALDCSTEMSVTWVDRYRDVLGLRLPDPRDHVEVVAPAGATAAVTFTDGSGAAYPTVSGVVPAAGVRTVEPPRPLAASERGQWRVAVALSRATDPAEACVAQLP